MLNCNKYLIGVVGAASCTPAIGQLAFETGKLIAENRCILVCGGLGGVMTESARGAQSAGGLTIGILPGMEPADANPYISIPIATGMDQARNVIIARSCHGLIAISGGYGTLSEIAFALKMNKPVVGIETWSIDPAIIAFDLPGKAVESLIERIKSCTA